MTIVAKVPSRSPTHLDVDPNRLAALGLELEELARDGEVELAELLELAQDRGKPPSHYLAALALADDLKLRSSGAGPVVTVCAGSCQQWGALDLLEHLAERCDRDATFSIVPVGCLDRCDRAAVCRIDSRQGVLLIEEATAVRVDEALAALAP